MESCLFHVSFPTRVFYTHRTLAMVVLSLLMMAIQIDASTTCSSNCSNVSPLPYPFGAKPGCGSPGFLITDCSGPTPLWNLTLAKTPHPYYISSIGPNPNHSNPHQGSIPNYGYGGVVVIFINNSTAYFYPLCEFRPVKLDNFTISNFYAFEDADLTFYQDHYLLFNCTSTSGSRPHSGVLTPSSRACTKYINYCNFGTSTNCFDYVPDKELQLSTLTTTLGCSSVRRYIIKDVDAPIPTWVSAAQFAWGPVRHADSCSSCQSSGGDCGYDVQEDSRFQCYCEDGTHDVSCHEASGKQIGNGIGVSIAIVFILVCGGVACYCRYNMLDEVLEEESEEDSWMSVSVDRLVEGEADLEQVKVCTLVALWCIQEDPALRPTMSKVVQYLQGTAIPENPPKPFSRLFNVSSQMPLQEEPRVSVCK
ncbi:hypothetical protein L7F22_032547 [Adiantum nelumboides]|nr:hypothetical protein [Adiantum nelumboides]